MARAPYYVWAPPYIQTSAGIRVLYGLVDELNRAGEEAWVAMSPYLPEQLPAHLNTPLLSTDVLAAHRASKRAPIAIYPEVARGNPVRASAVVRYLMNEPGLLGGPTTFPGELVFGYGAILAEAAGVPENNLFLPAVDPDDFPAPSRRAERDLVLFYASKYRTVHNAEPFGLPPGAREITRDDATAPCPVTLAEMLRKADRLYLYENSALAIEAPLCGCVAVMMPNEHLSYPIGAVDHGMGGIAWGDDPEELARARKTIDQMRSGYQAAIDRSKVQLSAFIQKSQAFADHDRPAFLDNRLPAQFNFSYPREAASTARRMLTADGFAALFRKGLLVFKQRGVLTGLSIMSRMALSMLPRVRTD